MDLYYSPYSPTTGAIIMITAAFGLEFNKIQVNLAAKENLTPEFLKLNPQHTIPTIVDNGFALWETRAIITYLVEKYGKDDSLYPKDPQKRAVVNQRLYFDLGTLFKALAEYYYPQFQNQPGDPQLFKKVEEALNFLDKFLEGKQYLAGDSFTVADIVSLSTISSFQALGLDISNHDNVVNWYENAGNVAPAWNEVEEGAANLKALFKSFQENATD
ncbi:glutathione S-transferase 1-1-like [Drosophila albomicans]|uniref:Glutathione S-transferase 1-1-like n=1 Tax=Drosophila albomicans TaxID=7291 RepID=A0A6P8X8K2_DROAB|nr:glutathione S-transferase 1-1-like [Drosophila albomicans]